MNRRNLLKSAVAGVLGFLGCGSFAEGGKALPFEWRRTPKTAVYGDALQFALSKRPSHGVQMRFTDGSTAIVHLKQYDLQLWDINTREWVVVKDAKPIYCKGSIVPWCWVGERA